jgi:hypothetical protein
LDSECFVDDRKEEGEDGPAYPVEENGYADTLLGQDLREVELGSLIVIGTQVTGPIESW